MKKQLFAVQFENQFWYVEQGTKLKEWAITAPLVLAKIEDIKHIIKEDIEMILNTYVWNFKT